MQGFLWGLSGRICLQYWKARLDPWVRKMPWRRAWQSAPVLLPGESRGQRSLAGCSPRGRPESDVTGATPRVAGSWSQLLVRQAHGAHPGSARALGWALSPCVGVRAWGPASPLRNGDGEASEACGIRDGIFCCVFIQQTFLEALLCARRSHVLQHGALRTTYEARAVCGWSVLSSVV